MAPETADSRDIFSYLRGFGCPGYIGARRCDFFLEAFSAQRCVTCRFLRSFQPPAPASGLGGGCSVDGFRRAPGLLFVQPPQLPLMLRLRQIPPIYCQPKLIQKHRAPYKGLRIWACTSTVTFWVATSFLWHMHFSAAIESIPKKCATLVANH